MQNPNNNLILQKNNLIMNKVLVVHTICINIKFDLDEMVKV